MTSLNPGVNASKRKNIIIIPSKGNSQEEVKIINNLIRMNLRLEMRKKIL